MSLKNEGLSPVPLSPRHRRLSRGSGSGFFYVSSRPLYLPIYPSSSSLLPGHQKPLHHSHEPEERHPDDGDQDQGPEDDRSGKGRLGGDDDGAQALVGSDKFTH